MREHVLLFCLLGLVLLSVGSGAHSHDHTGDRTGSRDLGAGLHRMSFPPPAPAIREKSQFRAQDDSVTPNSDFGRPFLRAAYFSFRRSRGSE